MENKITYVYVETTNHCRLNCSFCNREEITGKLQHMSIENYKILLDKIKDQPITEAKLLGLGEPFSHPTYHRFCKLFKETFPDANLISSTNCQYVINKNFKESLKYIDMLYLSIDGYEKTYEEYRDGARWDLLIDFLEDLKTINRYKCKIVINFVINPNNISDIQKVYDNIVLKYDLEELRLNFAQNWSENENMILDYTEEQINYIKDNWKDNVKGKAVWDYSDCFWVKEGIYVTVNGGVHVCRLNTTAKSIGNIFKMSLEEIRQNKSLQEVKKGCETNNPTNHCKNCSYKELVPLLKKIKHEE